MKLFQVQTSQHPQNYRLTTLDSAGNREAADGFALSFNTAGCWLCIYRGEAQVLDEYLPERMTTLELIWEDVPVVGR